MSALYGLFCKDGRPATREDLLQMDAALARSGPDGAEKWCDGPFATGHRLLYNTPEALYEKNPRVAQNGRLVFNSAARLDNRDELCDFFRIPHRERPTTPDGELMLRAYARWGRDAPDHLLGDWAFVAWHAEERRLFLARDQHGASALFYLDRDDLFLFATDQRGILALSQVTPRLNERKFAHHLAFSPGEGDETFYEGIRLLGASHTLDVTSQASRLRRYYVLEDASPIHLSNPDDYVEGLRAHLERAVGSNLRSHRGVGLELSGGLDSAGLAAMAAPMLASEQRQLHTYTSVPLQGSTVSIDYRVADESGWVRAIIDHVGHMAPVFEAFGSVSPLESIDESLDVYAQPSHVGGNSHWLHGFRRLARDQGVGALLNGYAGNATASWIGLLRSQSLLRLVRQGRWRGALRDRLFAWAPESLVGQIKRSIGAGSLWQRWALIEPARGHSLNLAGSIASEGHDLRFFDGLTGRRPGQHELRSAREQRLSVIDSGCWSDGAWYAVLNGAYALDCRIPLVDVRLIEFCLGIPDRFYYNGVARWLYRQALADLLPESIVWNHYRGLQGVDIALRLRRHRDEVDEALERLGENSLVQEWLNLARLREFWAQVRGAETIDGVTWMKARATLHGLGSARFLERFGEGSLVQSTKDCTGQETRDAQRRNEIQEAGIGENEG